MNSRNLQSCVLHTESEKDTPHLCLRLRQILTDLKTIFHYHGCT